MAILGLNPFAKKSGKTHAEVSKLFHEAYFTGSIETFVRLGREVDQALGRGAFRLMAGAENDPGGGYFGDELTRRIENILGPNSVP